MNHHSSRRVQLFDHSAAQHPAFTGGDASELALWMSATLAGMATAVLILRGSFFRKLLSRLGRDPQAPVLHSPSLERSLPMLAEAVLGSSKCAIASVFGPPTIAACTGAHPAERPDFWQGGTWYYPLARDGPLAIAINFSEDFASKVEFLAPPTANRS